MAGFGLTRDWMSMSVTLNPGSGRPFAVVVNGPIMVGDVRG